MLERKQMRIVNDPFNHGPKRKDINRMVHILFTFEDGTKLAIEAPNAAALFQARCNALGFLTGLENSIVEYKKKPWWRRIWK